jgi:DNA/RNA endonuclease YhcR with UshA esterase domain
MTIKGKLGAALAACLTLWLTAAPALAHHSVAPYDMINPVTVKGLVERLEWTSPHVYLYINVKDEKGNVEEWTIEIDSPNFLKQKGWTSTTVMPGDTIACTGGRSKTGARAMRCTTVELANGEKLRS